MRCLRSSSTICTRPRPSPTPKPSSSVTDLWTLCVDVCCRCASRCPALLCSEGEVFIQAKAALEDVYKIYCYHHDDANVSLKSYEKEEDVKKHFTTCVLALK